MTILDLGDCVCAGSVLTPGHRDTEMTPVPVSGYYLVTLDDGRHLVVDTGMSQGHIGDPGLTFGGTPAGDTIVPAMEPADDIVARLAEAGLTPGDVDVVVNTHLHFDHAGNNALFTAASIVVQREQYDFAQGHPSFPNRYWDQPGLRYELVDGPDRGGARRRGPPHPGARPGAPVGGAHPPPDGDGAAGRDAVHVQASYELDNWDGHLDPVAARESAAMLRRLAQERDAVYLLGHEPAQVARYPRFPHVFR